jgi:putative intracellular protease/amidase
LKDANFTIHAASSKGGAAPIDHSSVENFTDDESVHFNTSDPEAKELVSNTKKISQVKASDYAAVFVVGGHGPMIDLGRESEESSLEFAHLVEDFYAQGKVRPTVETS